MPFCHKTKGLTLNLEKENSQNGFRGTENVINNYLRQPKGNFLDK